MVRSADVDAEENILVSIVVPIYRVEDYIRKCVDSILDQTHENIEVILVDDGSNDGCPDICDEYQEANKRVAVIHKRNGGLSDARNAGLVFAKGEYVCFIDGDDYIEPEYVSTLLGAALKYDADVASCSFWFDFPYGKIPKSSGDHQLIDMSSAEAVNNMFQKGNGSVGIVAWNKLYRRSLFVKNGIAFPVGRIHEDVFTTYKLVGLSKRVVSVDAILYSYMQRDDSIMGLPFSLKRLDMLDALDEATEWVYTNHPQASASVAGYRLISALGILEELTRWDDPIAYDTFLSTGDRLSRYISEQGLLGLIRAVPNRAVGEMLLVRLSRPAYLKYRKIVKKIKHRKKL